MTIAGSLDANVLLRTLMGDVPEQHSQALALLESGGMFEVSDTALIEVIFVLGRAYGLTRQQQREAILGVVHQPMIAAESDLFVSALDLFEREAKLSFEDCYLLVRARHDDGRPLWTFDRKLAAQDGARLVGAGGS